MNIEEARESLELLRSGAHSVSGQVTLHLEGFVAWVTLSNPSAKNAMTLKMMVELADIVKTLEHQNSELVVIVGDKGTFCSGGDLREVKEHLLEGTGGHQMSLAMTAVCDHFYRLPAVTCALVDGYAVGGGAEMAMMCDYRLFQKGAKLQFVHRRLGIVPGWGATRRLVHMFGRRKAMDVLLQARPLGGEEAVSYGLADALVEGNWNNAIRGFFDAKMGLQGLSAVKRQVLAAKEQTRSGDESRIFSEVWGQSVHREALSRVHSGRKKA